MILVWHYYWPAIALALLAGLAAGLLVQRKGRRRLPWTAGGLLIALAATAAWHNLPGTADRFAAQIDKSAREALDYFEMSQVNARIPRRPLNRQLLLSGRADDFQRSELVRIMSELPGVSDARWRPGGYRLPLLAEVLIASTIAFLLGLLLAYLVELHRRANADRRW